MSEENRERKSMLDLRGVSLHKISEHIPGDVVIAIKHLEKLAAGHGLHIGVLALVNLLDDNTDTVEIPVIWAPILAHNPDLKKMAQDAIAHG